MARLGLAMILLLLASMVSGCGPILRQQAEAARADLVSSAASLETRYQFYVKRSNDFQTQATAFRFSLSDVQATKLNQAVSLGTRDSWDALITSLPPEQLTRLENLLKTGLNLESERQRLLADAQALKAEEGRVRELEAKYARSVDWSNRLFMAGMALRQMGQQQQQLQLQQFQQQQQMQLQMFQQQLEMQRTNCLLRAMQSRVPIVCP